jgi:hypothetical protein
MTKKVVTVVVIVILALAILQFSLNPPQFEALKGAGINKTLVIGAVVVLTALLGYVAWNSSQKQRP